MNFIEWMFLIYLLSITAVDAMEKNKQALYIRAGVSVFSMLGYFTYKVVVSLV